MPVFALDKLAHKVTHLGIDSSRSLQEELQTHAAKAVVSVVLGDLNVHHRRWLKFSNRNSWEGEVLCSICKEIGLTQLIREPTQGEHLLDLVLSSVSEMKTGVLPLIADHKPVTASLKLSVPSHAVAGRNVWRYRQADRERLRDLLDDTCWDHLKGPSTAVATKWVTLCCARPRLASH